MQAAAAVSDRADRGAADLQLRRNLAARQLAFFQQAIDFEDQRCGEHGRAGSRELEVNTVND
jgi:hypothetical protein